MTESKSYADAAAEATPDANPKGRNRNRGGGAPPAGNKDKFTGECTELKGHIFDTHSVNPKEGFHKTTRQLAGYIGRTYTRAAEFRIALETLKLDTLTPPKLEESKKTDVVEVELWKIELQEYRDDVKYRKENLQKVFSLILGQCTTSMKDRLQGRDGWQKINRESDVITLLAAIQEYSTSKTSDQDSSHKLMDAEISFFTFRQKKLTNADYLIAFKDKVELLERLKGERLGIDASRIAQYIKQHPIPDEAEDDDDDSIESAASMATLTKVKPKKEKPDVISTEDKTASNRRRAENACRDRYLATNLLMRSDPKRYGELIRATQNDYTRHRTPYPKTLAAAFRLLDNFISEKKDRKEQRDTTEGELAFVQETTRSRRGGRGGRGGRGAGRGTATAPPTPTPATAETTSATPAAESGKEPIVNADIVEEDEEYSGPVIDIRKAEAAFIQNSASVDPNQLAKIIMWLIMDSGSTIDMVANINLLTDVKRAKHPVAVRCNAGMTTLTHYGTLGGYPNKVWYHPKGIANILGLKNIIKHYRVTFDSKVDNAFYVHHKDGTTSRFAAAANGLYLLDTPADSSVAEWSLLATVKDKRKLYGDNVSKRADLARKVQDIIMHPSTRDYIKFIENKVIRNCPVERSDVKAAEDILGPNVASLKGKTPRRNPPHTRTIKDPVPDYIMEEHREITMEIDIMYVNKLPFLVTTSRGIKFGTVTYLPNRQVPTIKEELKHVCRLYRHRGFNISSILSDGEFKPLKPFFPQLECSGKSDHIPTVDRYIRTIKDRVRSTYNTLPFRYIPRVVLIRLVESAVFWLNALPPNGGASPTMSPRHIMVGRDIDYKLHIKAPFGQYVQTHEEHSNDMEERTLDAVCLGPDGNANGTHYFLNIATGKRIRRTNWTDVNMPSYVIDKVSSIGRRQQMPRTITFADRYGHEIHDDGTDEDDDHDSLYHPDEEHESDVSLDADDESESDDDDSSSSEESESDDDDDDDDDEDDDSCHTPKIRTARTRASAGVRERMRTTSTYQTTTPQHRSGPTKRQAHRSGGSERRGGNRSTIVDTKKNDRRDTAHAEEDSEINDESQRSPEDQPKDSNESNERKREKSRRTDQTNAHTRQTVVTTIIEDDQDDDIDGTSTQPTHDDDEQGRIAGVGGTSSADSHEDGHITGVGDNDNDDAESDEDDDEHGDDDESHKPVEERSDFFPFASDKIPEHITSKYGRGQRQHNDSTPKVVAGDDYKNAYNFFTMDGMDGYYAFLTAQMTAKKGLKVFGTQGADAIIAEMQQIHYRRVLRPRLRGDLSRDEIKAALHYLMFLKQKRCGRIKARGCADGRKQRLWKTKEETSAPTVPTEAVFLTSAIDAKEGRKVMTCDIPGAFMQADMDETVHVKFAGEIADLLCRVDPKYYRPYIVREGKKQVIYCELRKALYGTLQAALLFWKDLSGFLVDKLGFKLNAYDNCVANKTINGKQMTILWHVDDLKMSHVDQNVLEDILSKLNEKYGKEAPLTVTRGKKHDYLGMTIEYGDDGAVTFDMTDFVEGILDEAPDDMQGFAVTPAANYLFTVNDEANKLSEDAAELFHHLVAKLLYVCKRTRPDIHTAVAFLTTRVREPDVDDYMKLTRCIRYLRETPDLTLRLEVNDSGVLEWWVDASFAVHPDMKGHTGAVMTMGKGAAYTMSTRQKVNTKSSTVCELVGVDDAMPNIIWIRRFLEEQSYNVTDNVIYQDNQSAMLLERNGRRSCGKTTRHLDIRYFFITDRIAHGDCTVEYCPTDEMDADPLTKPLQGSKFRKFRQRLLNLSRSYRFSNPRQNEDSGNNGLTVAFNKTNLPQECVETVSQGGLKVPTSDSVKNAMSVPIEDEWIQVRRRRGKPIPTE